MGAMKELSLSGNGATANNADREYKDFHYLLPGQTLLIGGHLWYSYAKKLITTDTWYNNISDKLKEAYSEAGGYQLKGVFYHSKRDEETSTPVSPLDLMPGDAVTLVKIVNNQRYIIDATAPISSNAQGPFAGTLSKYKTEVIDKHANDEFFIMKRNDKVNFPFIPPYRTQRVNADAWSDDWTISTNKDNLTLGYRIKNTTRKWHKIDGTWARTPLAKWATYLNARPEH